MKNPLNDIFKNSSANSVFTGYIWMSDHMTPLKFDKIDQATLAGLHTDFCQENLINPFIVESYILVDNPTEANFISYSMKHLDGQYCMQTYSLDKTSMNIESYPETTNITMIGKAGLGLLHFKQIWQEEKDSQCLDMPVLQPKGLVFVGFNKANKEEKK